jgi:hypothetical protein
MLPRSAELTGRFDHAVIDSVLLRGNLLGDPHQRPLLVYLPPRYQEDRGRRYPVPASPTSGATSPAALRFARWG